MPDIINNKKYISELGDEEVISFQESKSMKEFLADRKIHDKWIFAYVPETSVFGVPKDAPILISSIREQQTIDADDDAINDCMGDMGLMLQVPMDDKLVTIPLRYTATNSLFERAGLTGRTLRFTGDGSLSPEKKAEWLTQSLALYKGMQCKILIRDGKVATDRSNQYVILHSDELVDALEATLRVNWPNFSMWSAQASHEFTVIRYVYNDDTANKRVLDTMKRCGFDTDTVQLGVKFVTSDIGSSAATLYPFLIIKNGLEIQLGNLLSMEHSTGASIEKWSADILPKLTSIARVAEEKIDEIANVKIQNPGGCLRNIACALRLPKEVSITIGGEYDSMYINTCTALDVYAGLFEIVNRNEEKYLNTPAGGYSPTQKLKYQEICAQALTFNFSEKDIDFEWKD